jgi:hypothetical protein
MRRCFTANSCPLDHRTTASEISIRCSFGNVTVSESVFPRRMGRAPVSASRYKKDSTRCRGRGRARVVVTKLYTEKRRYAGMEKGVGRRGKRLRVTSCAGHRHTYGQPCETNALNDGHEPLLPLRASKLESPESIQLIVASQRDVF